MRYIAAEDVAKAKEMDLLTYLRNYEPQELVHVSGNTYCTKEHDSLRISNGKWCWFSQGIGGRSALDYLIKVKGMLSNSEFVVMLNQAASDRGQLAKLLNISNEQMSYITNADAGCGLIKYGSALVPFINRFPQNTKLYQLMTTRPGEGKFARGRD